MPRSTIDRNRALHRHDEVDRDARHRKMAASARPGPQFHRPDFDVAEWERQHVEAEIQTLRYGPNMRDRLLRLDSIHFEL